MNRSILRVASLASILILAACAGEAAPTPTPTPTPTPAATGALGQIAFTSYLDGNWDIYVINTDGSNQTRLTDSPGFDSMPDWSPDGSKIAFVSTRSGIQEIYVMDTDGSNQTRITTFTPPHDPRKSTGRPAERLTPIWSPDGSKIVFTSVRDGNQADIYVMEADGSNEVRITTNPASDSNPTWSPDGTKIAFESDRDQITLIYVMDADGSNQTLLTHFPAPPARVNRPLCCPAWSPAR